MQIVEFLRKREDFVDLMIKHIGTSAIMDLLLRMLTCIEPQQLRQDVLNVSVALCLFGCSFSLISLTGQIPALVEHVTAEVHSTCLIQLASVCWLLEGNINLCRAVAHQDPSLTPIINAELVVMFKCLAEVFCLHLLHQWLNEEKVIQRLVDMVQPSQDEDVSAHPCPTQAFSVGL